MAKDTNDRIDRLTKQEEIRSRLRLKKLAYSQLFLGAHNLLGENCLFWAERLLLQFIEFLAGTRLEQLSDRLLLDPEETTREQVREAVREARIEATLDGHELGEWTIVGDVWQAACLRCGQTTRVGKSGLRYSLLTNRCGGQGE